MAKPIKETPVLTGKDAERFTKKMSKIMPESNKTKEEENLQNVTCKANPTHNNNDTN